MQQYNMLFYPNITLYRHEKNVRNKGSRDEVKEVVVMTYCSLGALNLLLCLELYKFELAVNSG